MHTYTYTYSHAYIYIYTCQYTYIHTHIYTHTYNMCICTHASTFETTALQRLRGKPDLTPKSSVLLPVRCNPEGGHPPYPAAQLPVHEERQISTEQPQPTAAHHTITTARHLDYNRSSALVRSRSTQFMAHPSCEPRIRPPETRLRFCHFGGVSMQSCLSTICLQQTRHDSALKHTYRHDSVKS